MFGLFRRKEPSPPPLRDTRFGRRGICQLCGTIKNGSLEQCLDCGFQPCTDAELAMALFLNERQRSLQSFDEIAVRIRAGGILSPKPEDWKAMLATVGMVKHTTGLGGPRYHARRQTEADMCELARTAVQSVMQVIRLYPNPSDMTGSSQYRLLACLTGSLQAHAAKQYSDSEAEFFKIVFVKRIIWQALQHGFHAECQLSHDEFKIAFTDACKVAGRFMVLSSHHDKLDRDISAFVFENDQSSLRRYRASSDEFSFGLAIAAVINEIIKQMKSAFT